MLPTKGDSMTTTLIRVSEFGAHTQYEMNTKRNKKNNIDTWCSHCAKAMTEGTGFEVRLLITFDCHLAPVEATEGTLRLIGNECIKKFLNAEQIETYARKVSA
jgi:hypothetical protein